mmetsp:Transcript_49889/g.96326  ORF Transcript_49889/g.96326 Transcript_49889/m.96326 type:complete len:214 (+) Transcript_49889:740-1381(+)
MHNNVHTKRQRLANDWRHHGAIHRQVGIVPVRHFGQRPQVCDFHQRVGRALCVDELRVWCDGTVHFLYVSSVHKTHQDAAVRAVLSKKPMHASVDICIADHMVTRRKQPCHCGECCHARGKGKAGRCLLEHCRMFFQSGARWIPRTRIVIRTEFASRWLVEGRRHVDWRVGGVDRIFWAAVKNDALRSWLQLILKGGKVGPDWKGWQFVIHVT